MTKALILTIFFSVVTVMTTYSIAYKEGQKSRELPSGTLVVTEQEWRDSQARAEEAIDMIKLKRELLELRNEKEEISQKLFKTQASLGAAHKEILILKRRVKGLTQDAIRLGHLVPEPREREKAE